MFPILFKAYIFTFYMYGLFIAIGTLVGMLYLKSHSRMLNFSDKKLYDMVFYIIIGSLVGGRLLYVLLNMGDFQNLLNIFKIWEGGLVFFGGVAGGGAAFFMLMKKWHTAPLPVLDVIAPAVALVHAIGRIGCFCAGCCYGAVTDMPWRVIFSHPRSLAPLGMPLHPTQLYSFLGNIAIFLFLHVRLKKKYFDGEIFFIYLVLYGFFRFFVEFFRADPRGPFYFSLSFMQYGSLIMVVAGIIAYIKRRKLAIGCTA